MTAATVSDVRVALEKQGRELVSAIERQTAIIERHTAIIERRLAIATYWLVGGTVAGHAATISVVIALFG